ncbi:MAG: RloB domain-containing protein [Christensenellales bacterium]|jgi:hypothetical protein
MPHQIRESKKYIVVFCEGESEQVYMDFLKKEFRDVAVIKRVNTTGLFAEADGIFRNNKKYIDNAEVTDEIWFFFDVETKDTDSWDARMRIIKRLRSLRKKPGIRIRLLMTTGCIEYWLMLHYEFSVPPIQTVAEKKRVMERLLTKVPNYRKGDADVTAEIAQNYRTAVVNARQTVENLLNHGLPSLADTDERNRWLCQKCLTFSNVYEAIDFLTSL